MSIKFKILGASVTAVDLGEDFIPVAISSYKKQGIDLDCIEFKPANIINLPFENGQFDFVCCHGVLLHLANYNQVEKAFSELSRVTKKGGYLYSVYGLHEGLVEKYYL